MVRDRWSLLVVLTCSYGRGAFGMLGVSPLSPALIQGFGLSRLDVAFIVPSVYVGGLLFSLPGGHFADRWGVRPTLLGALAMGGVGLLAAALAPHFVVFLLCLVVAGSGWSVVNPVLGKAIVDLFPLTERGIAMGIKQMGLTLGGGLSALVLPAIAASWGWRAAVTACAVGMSVPVCLAWRPLRALARPRTRAPGGRATRLDWWWTRRPPWLVLTGTLGALIFLVYAWVPTTDPLGAALLAFFAGIGAYGWVGIYFIISAEAGGATQSGLLSGVSFAAIVIGLLAGAPTFGLVLQAFDSYSASWTVFAGLSGVVALVVAAFGAAIHRECQPTLAR